MNFLQKTTMLYLKKYFRGVVQGVVRGVVQGVVRGFCVLCKGFLCCAGCCAGYFLDNHFLR